MWTLHVVGGICTSQVILSVKSNSRVLLWSAVYRQAVLTEVRAAQRRSMPALATLLLRRTSLLMILTVLSTSPPARDGNSVSPTSSKM